jgi:LPXTG-motif cell wall-anchored protein
MRRLLVLLSIIIGTSIWFSLAAPTISNISYSVKWDDIRINRTDNSDWWYIDINLQDPKTNDWLHFGEVKTSDQTFTYTKQWDWEQKVWMIPWDGWDEIRFNIGWKKSSIWEKTEVTRTVISAVPKTGPSGSLIWIILATLAIFGGYIYIKKRADI